MILSIIFCILLNYVNLPTLTLVMETRCGDSWTGSLTFRSISVSGISWRIVKFNWESITRLVVHKWRSSLNRHLLRLKSYNKTKIKINLLRSFPKSQWTQYFVARYLRITTPDAFGQFGTLTTISDCDRCAGILGRDSGKYVEQKRNQQVNNNQWQSHSEQLVLYWFTVQRQLVFCKEF